VQSYSATHRRSEIILAYTVLPAYASASENDGSARENKPANFAAHIPAAHHSGTAHKVIANERLESVFTSLSKKKSLHETTLLRSSWLPYKVKMLDGHAKISIV